MVGGLTKGIFKYVRNKYNGLIKDSFRMSINKNSQQI